MPPGIASGIGGTGPRILVTGRRDLALSSEMTIKEGLMNIAEVEPMAGTATARSEERWIPGSSEQPRDCSEQSPDCVAEAPRRAKRKPIGKRNKELGRKGEEAAARFLYRRGYEILERNWTCYAGEADIIAEDHGTLVFVEVKTRRDCQKGFPSEAVSRSKRDRYERIALAFLEKSAAVDMPVRFDVVALVVVGKDRALIRHHINAFSSPAM